MNSIRGIIYDTEAQMKYTALMGVDFDLKDGGDVDQAKEVVAALNHLSDMISRSMRGIGRAKNWAIHNVQLKDESGQLIE